MTVAECKRACREAGYVYVERGAHRGFVEATKKGAPWVYITVEFGDYSWANRWPADAAEARRVLVEALPGREGPHE